MLAAGSDVRFNVGRDKAIWVLPDRTLRGLDAAERLALSEWLETAAGIDSVLDLADRPWGIPGVTALFGVFETGGGQASWLVARCDRGWVLARPADGGVAAGAASLRDVLELIQGRA